MDERIKAKFDSYPANVKAELLALRGLIFDIAKTEKLGVVTECLKWQQLSYVTAKGSPVRLDWEASTPDRMSLFFHCQTRLVATFKEVYGSEFTFNGNRELQVPCNNAAQLPGLRSCITVALQYHQRKHQPLLGL